MIELRIANDDTSKKFINETIQNFHSYVPSTVSVGRRIDWVVFNEGKPVGMIGIGSSVYPPPKDILNYVKMKKEEYKNNFNSFANNWRFCMREKIKNAGTFIKPILSGKLTLSKDPLYKKPIAPNKAITNPIEAALPIALLIG